MKEKITEILKKYEDIELAYQYDVATEEEALKNKATPESIADEIMRLINQEVEKRIAERMPSDEEVRNELCRHLYNWLENNAFKDGCKWLRSRLTNPGDSQKTEGGE